jgi:hypothetical protein
MAELTFSDLNLHDSSVLGLNLTLDRNEPESFEIFLRYIENYETLRTSRRRMAFTDCRKVRIEGHLGFVRGNSILSGEVIEHSDLLAQTYSAWENSGLVELGSIFISSQIPELKSTLLPVALNSRMRTSRKNMIRIQSKRLNTTSL